MSNQNWSGQWSEITQLAKGDCNGMGPQMLALLQEIMQHDYNPYVGEADQSMRYRKIAGVVAKALGEKQ